MNTQSEQLTLESKWIDALMAEAFASMRPEVFETEVGVGGRRPRQSRSTPAAQPAPARDSPSEPGAGDIYESTVGEAFIRLRGRSPILSPLDAQMISDWRERGIPLHLALNAIEEVMGNHRGKRVRSIGYCAEEVEARYAEWSEGRVGAHV